MSITDTDGFQLELHIFHCKRNVFISQSKCQKHEPSQIFVKKLEIKLTPEF